MSTYRFLQSAVRRSLALAVVAGSAFAIAGAQTAPAADSASPAQPVRLQAPGTALSAVPQDALFSSSSTYSSSSDAQDAASTAAQMNLASLENGMRLPDANAQYGRRRYGRTRYRGGNTNADGSEKYTFFIGGGFTAPLGNTHHYYTPSWGFQVGGGRNFNKNLGVNLQFDWDNFGLQGNNLTQQGYIEDPLNLYGLQGATDGYSHVWSVTVDPTYTIPVSEGLGVYVTAGAGFYHKITTFTTPTEEQYCDPFYGICYAIEANAPFDSYTSNAPGVNGGIGFTYKFSKFANERLFAEVRYVVTFNSQRHGINGSNYNNYAPDYNYPTSDLYPANSNRSTYVPVKLGIRF